MIEEKMHDDLISRQQAIKALIRLAGRETKNEIIGICAERVTDGEGWIGGILDSISELEDLQPAMEIIHCEDCKWWDKDDDTPYGFCRAMRHGYHTRNWEISIHRKYKGDFFCGDAERRTDD